MNFKQEDATSNLMKRMEKKLVLNKHTTVIRPPTSHLTNQGEQEMEDIAGDIRIWYM